MGALINGANDAKWMDQALCAQTDPEAFYPERGASHREAKNVCERCPVRPDCLDWAIKHGESDGVWGGMGPAERKEEIQRRRTVTT